MFRIADFYDTKFVSTKIAGLLLVSIKLLIITMPRERQKIYITLEFNNQIAQTEFQLKVKIFISRPVSSAIFCKIRYGCKGFKIFNKKMFRS